MKATFAMILTMEGGVYQWHDVGGGGGALFRGFRG